MWGRYLLFVYGEVQLLNKTILATVKAKASLSDIK